MITKENKEEVSIAVCFIVVTLLNLGSLLLEFNAIKFIYFIFVIFVIIKYVCIKKEG